jgi:hypothetical protein
MENTFFSPERNITISAVVPISLKNKLLLEASKLGISLSEFLYHLIENSGCNAFSSNELTKKNLEIEALQKQVSELEQKLLEQENTAEPEEDPEEEETETPFDRLNTAYCDLKRVAFQNYAKCEIYKEADKLHKTELMEKTLPELQAMKAKGLENVADWLISQLKNPEKIDKAYFLEVIEKAFNEACQMDKIKFEPLTTLDQKNIYPSIQDKVVEKFASILEQVEMYSLEESDYNLLTECDVKETTNFLDKNFSEGLAIKANFYIDKKKREEVLATETKALPKP